ncbi:MAG: hypothetical protein GC165_07435 [Armatimonadetes bacterium]|nr:hypothetical protein [Armatimonadota bacterium]MBS1727372.1 hypothetical protein [Armatimonadota bacterium]
MNTKTFLLRLSIAVAVFGSLLVSFWFWHDAKRMNEETKLSAEDRKDLAAAHVVRQEMEQAQLSEQLRQKMRESAGDEFNKIKSGEVKVTVDKSGAAWVDKGG